MEQTRSALLKRGLTPWGKAGAALGIGVLVLAAIGLLFPTGAAFFPLVSLWCSCALFYGALWVLRVSGVTLDFFHRAVLVGCWAAAVRCTARRSLHPWRRKLSGSWTSPSW